MGICKECGHQLTGAMVLGLVYCRDCLTCFTTAKLVAASGGWTPGLTVNIGDKLLTIANRIDPTPYAIAAAASFGVTPEVVQAIKAGKPHPTTHPLASLPIRAEGPAKIDYSEWYDTDVD